jgi:hypothetical protein
VIDVDFRQLAKEAAGDGWIGLEETERRALIRAEQVAWLEGQLGTPGNARLTYGEWLKAQPTEVQDRALGVTRAQLFRAGGITIDKFTSPAGIPLTLEQLAATRPEAFIRAGLDPANHKE